MTVAKFSGRVPTDVAELAALLDEIETAFGMNSPEMRAVYQAMKEQEGAAAARSLLTRAGRLIDWKSVLNGTAEPAEVQRPDPEFAAPGAPFSATFHGYPDNRDEYPIPNVVVVELTVGTVCEAAAGLGTDGRFADNDGEVQLIQVDTNYKPSRTSDSPAMLRREDAIRLAGALFDATSHSFHAGDLGKLRPAQAGDLLHAVREVERKLAELREHLIEDLLDGVGLLAEPFDDTESEKQ